MEFGKLIDKKLQVWIKKNKKKRTEFADFVGIDASTLSRYINGKTFPKARNLLVIMDVLNIKYDEALSCEFRNPNDFMSTTGFAAARSK